MEVIETGTLNIKFKYTWTIHNFSKRFEENEDEILSPLFPEEGYRGLQWHLVVYPKGANLECWNFVSIFVQFVSGTKNIEDIPGSIKLQILNFPSKEIPIRENHLNLSTYNTVVGFGEFIERNVLLDGLIDDKLIIFCEISTAIDYQSASTESRLGNDFGTLFEYQDFNDVTLSVGRRKLKAHKAILGARSPVFEAMFKYDMKENLLNDVNITDVEYEVLKEMLRFMYTEKIQNLKEVQLGLLIAADKYQLDELKTICEKSLLSVDISAQNFFEIFVTADTHRAFLLKNVVLNYIRTHFETIISTPGWKTLMRDYPDLVEEAFRVLSENSSVIETLRQ